MSKSDQPKMVTIGFSHSSFDPRLYWRQMGAIQAALPQLELFLLTNSGVISLHELEAELRAGNTTVNNQQNRAKRKSLWGKLGARLSQAVRRFLAIWALRKLKPAIVQASDVRELKWAILCKVFTPTKIIYDAHEDYFNQVYEYGGKSFRSLARALMVGIQDWILPNFASVVFCTDEFLVNRYRRTLMRRVPVSLLRNFPRRKYIATSVSVNQDKRLRLVYVGSVNKVRGLLETAEFCNRFNDLHGAKLRLEFYIYAQRSEFTEYLVKKYGVFQLGWRNYDQLSRELEDYDVGVCLWQRLKKFERNLPIKNFEYMAAGLPVLTSNFGNLQTYAIESGAAICIEPNSYDEFEKAIWTLSDSETREEMGVRGRQYIITKANFDSEAEEYLNYIRGCFPPTGRVGRDPKRFDCEIGADELR